MDRLTIILAITVFGGVFSGAMFLWPQSKAPGAQAQAGTSSSAAEVPLNPDYVPDLAVANGGGETFTPGNWQMRVPLSGAVVSLPNNARNEIVTNTCLPAASASVVVKQKVLELIGRQSCTSENMTARDGNISGTLTCPGSYDIREHPEHISGYYNPGAIHVTISMAIYGTNDPALSLVCHRIRTIGGGPVAEPLQPALCRLEAGLWSAGRLC